MRNLKVSIIVFLSFILTISQGYGEKILFHDEFDEGVLSSSWELRDPKYDSTLTFARPGWLEIKAISGNDLQPKSNLNAPRLLHAKAVSGDFAIETSISAPKNGRFQSGGLLIWKDEDNFLRFERGTWGADTVILQKREYGIFGHIVDLFFEENPAYLRMERRKSCYKALISEDKKKWKEVCSFNFDASDPLGVGIHAICMGIDLPPTITDFDYFKLSQIGDEAPYIAQAKMLSERERRKKQSSEEEKLLTRAREVLSKTASEREAENKDIIIDSETGVKFVKKLVDERLDVIQNPYAGVSVSPDGRFLYNASDYWVVPLEEGEPFKLLLGFRGDIIGRWSPDMNMFAFLDSTQNSLWVIPVSPDTSRPTGPPEKIVDKVFEKSGGRTGVRWSPDSKWIAFQSNRAGNSDIWMVSHDGSNLTRLTDDPISESLPEWTPDGKSIIYTKWLTDASKQNKIVARDIWIMPVEGGEHEKLATVEKENVTGSKLSPDGKWLGLSTRNWSSEKGWVDGVAFLRLSDKRLFAMTVPEEVEKPVAWSIDSKQVIFFKTGYDWESRLMVINTYGGPWVELGKERELVAWSQDWTPDGEKIITDGETDFWIIPTKGGPSVKLELKPDPKPLAFVVPSSFSPDLTKSAYVSEDYSLWVLPISVDEAKAAGKPVKVGEKFAKKRPFGVRWSPDSKWIAFPSGEGDSRDIWVASVEGGESRQLTKQPADKPVLGWSWSGDSKDIAYEAKGGIWVVPSSGGEPRQLVESDEVEDHAWSPDGKEIAFIEKSYISIVNAQTSEIKHILDLKAHNLDGEDAWDLEWSPDGKKIGFIGSKNSESRYRIWVISIPDGHLMELAADDSGDKYYFSWSPDGRKVAYNSDRYFKVRTGALWAMDVEELVSKME